MSSAHLEVDTCPVPPSNEVEAHKVEDNNNTESQVQAGTAAEMDTTANIEYLYARRKCRRCAQYYTLAVGGKCSYHTGKYDPSLSFIKGRIVGWTCCNESRPEGPKKVIIDNVAAQKVSCPGCKHSEHHEEDEQYSQAVSHFPFDAYSVLASTNTASTLESSVVMESNNRRNNDSSSSDEDDDNDDDEDGESSSSNSDDDETEKENKKKKKNKKKEKKLTMDKMFYRHPIKDGETLVGIALGYGIPLVELQRVNRLPTRQIFQLTELLIPVDYTRKPLVQVTSVDPKAQAIINFKRKTGCLLEEATYYLESSEYNMEVALAEYRDDLKWEATHARNKKQPGFASKLHGKPAPRNSKKKNIKNTTKTTNNSTSSKKKKRKCFFV